MQLSLAPWDGHALEGNGEGTGLPRAPPDTIIQVIPSGGQPKASGEDSGKLTAEAETEVSVPWGWVCPNQWGQLALELSVMSGSLSVRVHLDEPQLTQTSLQPSVGITWEELGHPLLQAL